MKEVISKYYKDILLVIGYTVAAALIYGVLFHQIWSLWWVDVITVFVIALIGTISGVFYIKHLIKKNMHQEETTN